ncbi:hypothetical protein RhiirC2_752009 [Rhizophagus irregularis]|uniref:Serine-threonine/tyrosine-protein kinase catalytic domain-containing protein n=2 Tax=Rhizophagus irregularis TaxID=588596 RepID=A0A2N1N040_9GLOM|nr:hypothetical protein RhiirC2_752009 [Rhizophagus irregularis]
MTGRKPFWDRNHDTELIIEICDGLRPPIVTNAPEGYVELMQKCWHYDPNKRPTAYELKTIIRYDKLRYEHEKNNPTKIINSPDIGPITNNPGAVYKSRPLSAMISSAESTRSLRSQSISLKFDKRKFNDSLLEEKINKKVKLFENENNDYLTTELELDIDNNIQSSNNDYITEEINLDIDTRCGLNF